MAAEISDIVIFDCARRRDWKSLCSYIDNVKDSKDKMDHSLYNFYEHEAEYERPERDFIRHSFCSRENYLECLEKTLLSYEDREEFYDLIHLSLSKKNLLDAVGGALAKTKRLEESYFRVKEMIDAEFGYGYEVLEKATAALMKDYDKRGRTEDLLNLSLFAEDMMRKGYFRIKDAGVMTLAEPASSACACNPPEKP